MKILDWLRGADAAYYERLQADQEFRSEMRAWAARIENHVRDLGKYVSSIDTGEAVRHRVICERLDHLIAKRAKKKHPRRGPNAHRTGR